MNCKFCNNVIADNASECPICGKKVVDDETLARLGAIVAVPDSENELPTPPEPVRRARGKRKKHKKSLVMPLILMLIGVGGWLFCLATDSLAQYFYNLQSLLKIESGIVSTPSGESFTPGTSASSLSVESILLAVVLVILTILAVTGLIMFFVRLANKIKYRDE